MIVSDPKVMMNIIKVGICPLERLPIDMIKDVPIDYMHAVCLGAMKRLLKF